MRGNVDIFMRAKYSYDEYRNLKSKAGMIGGAIGGKKSRLPADTRALIGESIALYKLSGKEIHVLCIKDIGNFQRGKRYKITIERGEKIKIGPHTFEKFTDVARHFKHIKVKEK